MYLRHCYSIFKDDNYIFISDRENGMATAATQMFPAALHFHYCQHIADNLQQRYRNKVRPLFWIAARAKTSITFKATMKVIQEENKDAFQYPKDIDKKL